MARFCVSAFTPAFDNLEAVRLPAAAIDASDEMFTMAPLPDRLNSGTDDHRHPTVETARYQISPGAGSCSSVCTRTERSMPANMA